MARVSWSTPPLPLPLVLRHGLPARVRVRVHPHACQVAVRASSSAPTPPPPPPPPSPRPFSAVPGPQPLPLIGNVWRFMPGIGDLGKIPRPDFLKELHRRYGPLVRLDGLFGRPKLFLADPDAIQQVFHSEGRWPMREGVNCFKFYYNQCRSQTLGRSVGTSEGALWQELRTKTNPIVMQPRSVLHYLEQVDRISCDFIQRMQRIRDANQEMPDSFEWELGKWALESITYVCLDTRLGAFDSDLPPDSPAEAARVLRAVREAFDATYHLEFGASPYQYVSTPTWRRFRTCMDYFTETSERHVRRALEPERLQEQAGNEHGDQPSALKRILKAFDGDPMQATGIVMDLIFGGVDTTSNQMALVMYLLATHPAAQRALQEELDRELPSDGTLNAAVLGRLRYTRACIKETFRFLPVIQAVSRVLPSDLILDGYLVPKGTNAICSFSVPAMDERYVPRASEFLPERWLHEPEHDSLKVKHPFVHLPFGFGPRACIGKRFAELELLVLTARLFHKMSLQWRHPAPSTDMLVMLSLTSPLRFTATDRQ